jgi:ribonuclease R
VEVNLTSVKGEPEGVYFKVSKDANHLIRRIHVISEQKSREFIGKRKLLFIEFMMNQMR